MMPKSSGFAGVNATRMYVCSSTLVRLDLSRFSSAMDGLLTWCTTVQDEEESEVSADPL
jgi:hypothetical protein